MPRPADHRSARRPLGAAEAEELAESVRAFGSASRLRLLGALVDGERTVDQLARGAAVSPSAASHQLRVLRLARLVRVRRTGRHAFYALYDHHVGELLAALRHHHEHVHPPDARAVGARGARSARR
jgi:DNA-binding transcriptional ArsR family regulator